MQAQTTKLLYDFVCQWSPHQVFRTKQQPLNTVEAESSASSSGRNRIAKGIQSSSTQNKSTRAAWILERHLKGEPHKPPCAIRKMIPEATSTFEACPLFSLKLSPSSFLTQSLPQELHPPFLQLSPPARTKSFKDFFSTNTVSSIT